MIQSVMGRNIGISIQYDDLILSDCSGIVYLIMCGLASSELSHYNTEVD